MPTNLNTIPSNAASTATNNVSTHNTAPVTNAPPSLPPGNSSGNGTALPPQNAGRGAFLRSLQPAEQALVQSTYDATRQYHGTSAAGKASIQHGGFDIGKKAGGATETVANVVPQTFVDDAGKHNYLTSNEGLAKKYAVTGKGTPPALVRTVVDQAAVGLHPDPDSDPADNAVRTRQNIPAGNVLQSKKHGDHHLSGDANRHFQQQLGNHGLHVSADEAEALLADVQSDSDDDDFTGVTPMGVA